MTTQRSAEVAQVIQRTQRELAATPEAMSHPDPLLHHARTGRPIPADLPVGEDPLWYPMVTALTNDALRAAQRSNVSISQPPTLATLPGGRVHVFVQAVGTSDKILFVNTRLFGLFFLLAKIFAEIRDLASAQTRDHYRAVLDDHPNIVDRAGRLLGYFVFYNNPHLVEPEARPDLDEAIALTTYAERFLISHELAHCSDNFMADAEASFDDAELGWAHEYAADSVALRMLIAHEPDADQRVMLPSLWAGMEFSLHAVSMATIASFYARTGSATRGFAMFEDMHDRANPRGSHPPAAARINMLRRHLDGLPDPAVAEACRQLGDQIMRLTGVILERVLPGITAFGRQAIIEKWAPYRDASEAAS